MAKTLTISEEESLSTFFKPIMDSHQLRVVDLQGDGKIHIHGEGAFDCTDCDNQWSLIFSWVTISLIEQKIVYRWKMKCKTCLKPYQPTFSLDQFKEMINKAVLIYTRLYRPTSYRRRGNLHFRPHQPLLCEKCGYCPYTPCWARFV
ncbi:uncharacterized protein LOC129217205 [Uloborus diversus]|uniref:uncharacterized protein LOC129217205 n=1 Tax=Uloborus diversus TaxID=327109 RepID=UPI00240A67F7|nr:uncharacterized protein LOC129217205 [Uloborus diversus]XP_054707448.1 uncharacterized protein LOC129217205 [Uloborus diversus]XP_054707449.1 uncharacterized protein LOC129217205 [Uloborus diversus]